MKANYVERPAPEMPNGRIRGLEPHARDVAVRLGDSISARFSSLLFHHSLLARLNQAQRTSQLPKHDVDATTQRVLANSWQAHFLFDDLVFNAASLCDYLGNAVWFGFHGANYINKKWKNTYDAAKRADFESKLPRGTRIHGSRTGKVIVDAHVSYVNDLYAYRSELIHYTIDGPDVYSHTFWEDRTEKPELPVPRTFSKRLNQLFGVTKEQSASVDIVSGAYGLVVRLGELTLATLSALCEDLPRTADEPLIMLM